MGQLANNKQHSSFDSDDEILSTQVVAEFTQMMVTIIDERIRKRFESENIAKVYNAEIVGYTTTEKTTTYNFYEGAETTTTAHKITTTEISTLTVECNDYTVTISNNSVKAIPYDLLSNGGIKWVKVCTYDGVQFYFLHCL